MTTTPDKIVYAHPASAHFGGFGLERSVQQRVRVYNNNSKAMRLRFTFPSGNQGFRATFVNGDRPSFVSPGLYEEILVSFTPPAGFQYYYDCIRVQCEEVVYGLSSDVVRSGATIIPLHAYTMVNEVTFPTRMDFGAVLRGTCARKFVNLTCSVPVEFEYELQVTKPHPAFTVCPLKGTIPSKGEARIEIEYRPVQYATASTELTLHVSQMGFTPRVCTLVGSSSSTVAGATSTVDVIDSKSSSLAPASLTEKGRHRPTRLSKTRFSKREKKSRSKKHAHDEPQLCALGNQEESKRVQSIELSKLKFKNLKEAIATNRTLHHQQEKWSKLSPKSALKGEEKETTALSFETLVREEEEYLATRRMGKQVNDMYSKQELQEMGGAGKKTEFQSHKVRLGQRLLSRQQLAYLSELREKNHQVLIREQRDQLCTTFHNVRYENPIYYNRQNKTTTGNQHFLRGDCKAAVLPAHYVPTYTPDFKLNKSDLWERRQRVLQRLVRAVSTCILRQRAQKRLDRIRVWFGKSATRTQTCKTTARNCEESLQANDSKTSVAIDRDNMKQKPLQEWEDAASKGGQRQLYLSSFPAFDEIAAPKLREKIDLPTNWEPEGPSFTFMEFKPRDEALLMGHVPLPLPALPTYVPLENARVLRQGAKDECEVVFPLLFRHATDTGTKPTKAVHLPSLLEVLPPNVFLRPQASVRPLVDLQGPRETEATFALRPRRVHCTLPITFRAWQNSQIGLKSAMESHDGASLYLSDVFINSTDRHQADAIFVCPANSSTAAGNESNFGDAWNVAHPTVPSLAERAEDVPNLSDSESDEGDDIEIGSSSCISQVSWKYALELFEDQIDDKAAEMYEDGELLGRERGVYSFERYRHLIRQERAYNTCRHEHIERLPKLLDIVSAQTEQSDYALIVRGHGPDRPLHNVNDQEYILKDES